MWIKCREGIHILIVYLWHSEGWSVRNVALMSNWIIAFDANMEPNDFAEGDWVKEDGAEVKAPPEAQKYGKRQITLWSVNFREKSRNVDVVNESFTATHSSEMHG